MNSDNIGLFAVIMFLVFFVLVYFSDSKPAHVVNNYFMGFGANPKGVVFAFYNFNDSVYKCPMVYDVYDCDYFMGYSDFINKFEVDE